MTTYDQIWTAFMDNGQFPEIDLPKSEEKVYATIHNGVKHFNNKMDTAITCDDASETINKALSDSELLILAYFIKLIFRKNQLTAFQGVYQPFNGDIGFRNYSAQIRSIESSIAEDKDALRVLIMNNEEDFL
ncbi:hypothetical protein SAMN05421503_1431 [Terribacillus aidingensis]|uniref:Uncharacterized protein n=1 Tax=Terribacillus aidingensis TaxID=586416 RepID=A0A285NKH3_9BACI|nr:hypothetical protein [Terribacillus aidingensis]SNZ09945.1 hypothetical protein SAMN05421503_1431 [Terribacillus aidingensis]